MKRRPLIGFTATLALTGGVLSGTAVPFGVEAAVAAGTSSAVTSLSGDPSSGAITGTATFGGQDPVQVADDPANDANLTPRVGDSRGTEPGVDLLTASLSVPSAGVPELLVQWQVADLPADGIVPEGVRYSFPFKVGNTAYLVQAKYSNAADPDTAPDAHAGQAFELRGSCVPSFNGTGVARCSHVAWLAGSVDPVSGTISARVPLGSPLAPGLVPGAALRRNDSPSADLNDIIAGYQAGLTPSTPLDDRATFGPSGAPGFSFALPAPEVSLGVAPAGTDPRDLEYDTPAALAADGSFSGEVSTAGLAPGTFDVFARACFSSNCGYLSLGGAVLAIGDLTAVLSIPGPGEPDRSFAFWDGADIGDRLFYSTPSTSMSNCTNSPCFTYKLRVDTPGAARLRIGLDASMRNDGFSLQVVPPSGNTRSAVNSNAFNSELFFDDPPTGIYTVLVRPVSTENSEFAIRAKLEKVLPVRQPNEDGLLPPNLRPTAPYELGFAAPINPLNGPFLAPDDANPPVAVGGHGPVSCSPDETLDDQVVRCLRFSFGLANIGPGNFDVRSTGGGGLTGGTSPLIQCVERPAGTPIARPAGTTTFHPTHLHDHYNDLIMVELHRVTDAQAGTMVPAGDGRKLGYSPADQSIADWFAFNQNERGTSGSAGTCQDGAATLFGLSVGWGDVYRYQRAGNFVDFGVNLDGLYVIRLVIDPLDNVLEANETDNVGYTYVRVTLDSIEVLEHGRGLSPWDPNKHVLQLRRKAGVPW